MYERHINGICSAIIACINDTAFIRREEPSEQIHWLLQASTSDVEAVKDSGQLQENLIKCVGSDNRIMHDMYNRIQVHIAFCIRDLEEIRVSGEGVMDVLELDSIKFLVVEEHDRFSRSVADLIARREISPSMGSSLVNDSRYAHDISMNLVRAAQIVFAAAEDNQIQAAQDVVLDKSDIDPMDEVSSTGNTNV
jgi:phosphate:Na+ symporter